MVELPINLTGNMLFDKEKSWDGKNGGIVKRVENGDAESLFLR